MHIQEPMVDVLCVPSFPLWFTVWMRLGSILGCSMAIGLPKETWGTLAYSQGARSSNG